MALPLDKSRWATLGATITDPSSGQRDTGWTFQQNPPSGVFNSWMNNIYLHIQYLRNITAEALTWTALQNFSVGMEAQADGLGGRAGEFTSPSGATFRNGTLLAQQGDYTGAGTGVQLAAAITAGGGAGGSAAGGGAVNATGGDSTSGTGGYGVAGGGGNSTSGNGGNGVIGSGGEGVTGGDGGQFLGGESTSATLQGGTGAYHKGGINSASGKGGYGAILEGSDGAKESGLGGFSKGGDVIGTAGLTALRAAHHFKMGSAYTDGTKTTYAGPISLESTGIFEAGFVKVGGLFDTATGGVRVINPTGFTPGTDYYSFVNDQHGLDLDEGQYLRLRPPSLANLAVNNYRGPSGSFNHMSMAAVSASVTCTGVSGTSVTFSVLGDSIGLAASGTFTLTSSNRVRVAFERNFVNTAYMVQAIGARDSKVPVVAVFGAPFGKNVSWVEFIIANFDGTSIDLRDNASVFQLDIAVFGRQVA